MYSWTTSGHRRPSCRSGSPLNPDCLDLRVRVTGLPSDVGAILWCTIGRVSSVLAPLRGVAAECCSDVIG